MYFVLDCIEPLTKDGEAPLMVIANKFEIDGIWSWKSGQPLEQVEIPKPIQINFKPLRGYKVSSPKVLASGVAASI